MCRLGIREGKEVGNMNCAGRLISVCPLLQPYERGCCTLILLSDSDMTEVVACLWCRRRAQNLEVWRVSLQRSLVGLQRRLNRDLIKDVVACNVDDAAQIHWCCQRYNRHTRNGEESDIPISHPGPRCCFLNQPRHSSYGESVCCGRCFTNQ